MAYEFATATTGSVKMSVGLNESGYLATGSDTAVASKTFSIQGIKADANLSQANSVFNAFIGQIATGKYDSLSAVKTISVGVVETN